MSKFYLFFALILFVHSGNTQEHKRKVYGSTEFNLSLFHLGSYNKERPIIALEQEVIYHNSRIWFGLRTGINVYPALLAIPLGISVYFPIYQTNKDFVFAQGLDRNLGFKGPFLAGFRYRGSLGWNITSYKSYDLRPALGYRYIWDTHGGKSLSFTIGLQFDY